MTAKNKDAAALKRRWESLKTSLWNRFTKNHGEAGQRPGKPGKERNQLANQAQDPAVVAEDLTKSYGATRALRGLSFQVPRGCIFAYLGPNGAGKTTTINILSGLLKPDSGRMSVCGLDVSRDTIKVKERIGVVPDESNLYPELSCRRNLDYLGQLYGLGRDARQKRITELLELFGLTDRSRTPFRALSRGLKRRLVLAAALVHSPEVLFLDEPTIGLDVPSARSLRQIIRQINQKGATVFLTTHNLLEAEALADLVCILIEGQVMDVGTPDEIRGKVRSGIFLKLGLSGELKPETILAACPAVKQASRSKGVWRMRVDDLDSALKQAVAMAEAQQLTINEVSMESPNLEEALLAYIQKDQSTEAEGKCPS